MKRAQISCLENTGEESMINQKKLKNSLRTTNIAKPDFFDGLPDDFMVLERKREITKREGMTEQNNNNKNNNKNKQILTTRSDRSHD